MARQEIEPTIANNPALKLVAALNSAHLAYETFKGPGFTSLNGKGPLAQRYLEGVIIKSRDMIRRTKESLDEKYGLEDADWKIIGSLFKDTEEARIIVTSDLTAASSDERVRQAFEAYRVSDKVKKLLEDGKAKRIF